MNYFLPFLRLAPVQCTSYGIQVTTGIPNIDYYLSSDHLEIESAEEHYSETLVRARDLLHFEPATQLPDSPCPPEQLGLPSQGRLYGCLQRPGKIHPDFDPLLAGILEQDRDGRILLLEDAHGHAARQLRRRFERTMPEIAERIVWLGPLPRDGYLSALNCCQVVLDPPHFGGFTTTYEALALEIPVVTLPTDQQRGRYTAACLRALELHSCITADGSDYVNTAVQQAADADRRQVLASQIRATKHRLFENSAAISEHERIFHELLSRVR